MLKRLFCNEEIVRLSKNFLSLASVQAINYLLPLVTLPYLTRVLGVEKFGALVFVTAIINYLTILTDYGFVYTATRQIAIDKNNIDRVSLVFSTVMFIKMALIVISLVIVYLLTLAIPLFRGNSPLVYFSFLVLIGQTLLPVWFFQGMEKMKYVAHVNILAKLIFVGMIFVFVRSPEDIYRVPLLNALGFSVSTTWALYIVKKEFGVRWRRPRGGDVWGGLLSGWYMFVTTLAGNLYGQGNVVILGFLTNPVIVGYYALAQKITLAIVGLYQIGAQTLYPYLYTCLTKNREAYFGFVGRVFIFSGGAIFFVFSTAMVFSKSLYILIGGYDNEIGYYIFSFWLVIGVVTSFNVVFNPVLVSLGLDKRMALAYIVVGILFLLLSPVLTELLNYKGMLFAMLFVEVVIFIFSFLVFRKCRIESLRQIR